MVFKNTSCYIFLIFFLITLKCVAQIDNTFNGQNAGTSNTGSYNNGFGKNALLNNTNNSNCAFGVNSLKSNAGGFNCAFGNESLTSNLTGNLNCALGTRSLLFNTSGSRNVAIGHRTLEANIIGSYNTAVGYASLINSTGSGNVALGYYNGTNLISGDSNIFIGSGSGGNLKTGSYNNFLGNVKVNKMPSNTIFAGEDINSTIILADGIGNQRMFIDKRGNVGIGLGNNIIPLNKLDVNGGVAIGKSYTPKGYISSTGIPIFSSGFVAPSNGLIVEGNVGIGTSTPNSKVEITQGTNGNSGLRFTNLTNTFIPTSTQVNTKFLSVDAEGDVILQNVKITNQLTSSGNVLTSNVNQVSATANIINSISNTINSNHQLVTTVNGVASNPVTLPMPNNYQTLSQSGNTITLSNGGGSFNLPTFVDTDSQSLALAGNVLSISNGNSVALPSTQITAGTNITVTGNGTTGTPYQISATDNSIYSNNGVINGTTTINNNRVVDLNSRNIWFKTTSGNANEKMYLGSTAVYPNTTGNYKLFVEGGIMAEKVKVAIRNSTNWADYVFEDSYSLMPLTKVAEYILTNKHLPGIDAATDLAKNGLDIAEMQSKQMAKIEELTLYIIEQDKKLQEQSKAIEAQAQELQELKSMIKAVIEKSK